MKPKVYKAKFEYANIVDTLGENSYEQIGITKEFDGSQIKISLFFDVHQKIIPEWVEELLGFFDSKDSFDFESPNQYNSIIIVETRNSIYLLPKGHAFWVVEKISELDFGLDFAEKVIHSKDILMKSVSYVQRNKMRGILNYKKDQNEFPQASESYFYVSGKPEMEPIFGSSIDCGTGVTFSKSYNLSQNDIVKNFCQLFNEIDIALNLPDKKSIIPRLHRVPKKDDLYNELNVSLLTEIKESEGSCSLLIDINRIQLVGSRIEILENEQKLSIYLSGEKVNSEEEIGFDDTKIIDYIRKNSSSITDLNQIKFALYTEEGSCIKKDITFAKIVYCELDFKDKVYVLDNGRWGYFNNKFYSLLEEKLLEIDESVVFEEMYSIEYESQEKGEFSGEGGYIEELVKNSQMFKLHKRNLIVSGSTIEIADVYDKKLDELLAIKRGTSTSLAMYSFEQSLLSIQVLANKGDFNVTNELLKYNNRGEYKDEKKYPYLSESLVTKLVACKNASVLWLIDDKPKYVLDKVLDKSFKLKDFNSLMLKLKIVDWYSFVKDNGYTPKLYFALDRPIKESQNI